MDGDVRHLGKEPNINITKGILCPKCRSGRLKTTNTVPLPDGRTRRYKKCSNCNKLFSTIETVT